MRFLHYRIYLNSEERVRVALDSQANVKVMDDSDFCRYKRGTSHHYYGGLATRSPLVLGVPNSGFWNVVVDLGGYSGSVRASVAKI